MRRQPCLLAAILTLFAAANLPAQAPVLTADLVKDISEAEQKFVALANVLNAEQYRWRPGEGVRSAQEVLLHVAADNYFIPAAMGTSAPAETGIIATDFQAVMAFEKKKLDQAGTVAALKASFNHLRAAMNAVPASRLDEKVTVFGQEFTVRQFMILATTHMHEHLGQLIAYARTNGVKPPWTR